MASVRERHVIKKQTSKTENSSDSMQLNVSILFEYVSSCAAWVVTNGGTEMSTMYIYYWHLDSVTSMASAIA